MRQTFAVTRDIPALDEDKHQLVSAPPTPRVGVVDYLRSLPFVIAFVSILVSFDVMQRLVLLFRGPEAFRRFTVYMNVCLIRSFSITGARLKIELSEEVDLKGPMIIISNHQSLMDIPLLYYVFGRMDLRFISKRELGKWLPFVSFCLRNGGHTLIDRGSRRQAVEAIEKLGREMGENAFAVSVFPEGTRARDGALKRFKVGGLEALRRQCPGVKVLPVAIDGLWEFARFKLMPVPSNLALRVRVGEAFVPDEKSSSAQVMEQVYSCVADALHEMRSEVSVDNRESREDGE